MTHLFPDAWCCCPCVYRFSFMTLFFSMCKSCFKVEVESSADKLLLMIHSPLASFTCFCWPCGSSAPPLSFFTDNPPPPWRKNSKSKEFDVLSCGSNFCWMMEKKKPQQFSCCSLEMFMSLLELAEFQARSRTGKEVGHRNRSFLLFAVAACEQDYTIVPDNVVPSNCVLGPWFDMVTTTFHKPTCERLWWLFKSKITCRAQRAL